MNRLFTLVFASFVVLVPAISQEALARAMGGAADNQSNKSSGSPLRCDFETTN